MMKRTILMMLVLLVLTAPALSLAESGYEAGDGCCQGTRACDRHGRGCDRGVVRAKEERQVVLKGLHRVVRKKRIGCSLHDFFESFPNSLL